jgi:hypothetical protein
MLFKASKDKKSPFKLNINGIPFSSNLFRQASIMAPKKILNNRGEKTLSCKPIN